MTKNQKVARWMGEQIALTEAEKLSGVGRSIIDRMRNDRYTWGGEHSEEYAKKLAEAMGTTLEWFNSETSDLPMPVAKVQCAYYLSDAQLRVLWMAEELSRDADGRSDPALQGAIDRMTARDLIGAMAGAARHTSLVIGRALEDEPRAAPRKGENRKGVS